MRSSLPRMRGFSVVELLVSVAIGLLALGFATRLVTGAESAKSSAIATSDSMQNGMLAMFSISGDAQQAGYGLNDPLLVGCNTFFRDTEGYELAAAGGLHPLVPALIESNGTRPDTITLYSGSSQGGSGTARVVGYDANLPTSLQLGGEPYGFSRGDVVVLAAEDGSGDCALAQVSADPVKPISPANPVLKVAEVDVDFRYNANEGSIGIPVLPGNMRVFHLGRAGALSFHTWSVDQGFLQLRATDMAGASRLPATVADNIVSIKAQYGFDTRDEENFVKREILSVGKWSPTMIDADGIGGVGNRGDYQRIVALRIAVVARSKKRESQQGGCTATTARPTVFASQSPVGVNAVPMEVDVAVPGDPVDWRCYRYRVFETVMPMRNSQWSPNNAAVH
ncbi:pilus assembly protein PilW [Massilia sp. Dwa41.01b]|uniref:PilW family protein n=1 Tax=unclassified Massilia TaxID=2609279 RepID=UPI001600D9BB|nr:MULTISPECIES: PilW family protein [unclassified Massilia]QNA89385.1 pilus assembly protein PilW [Massilia sp. Dwa41.01b]QNB00283.1 pilus assembly protein PilW [Massilia sp. Se16.2.3]